MSKHTESNANRRKHERHPVNEGTVAVFTSPVRLDYSIIGQILNIGLGGLAVRYLPAEEIARGLTELAIYSSNRSTPLVSGLFYEVIYDAEEPNSPEFDLPIFHRCGIKFKAFNKVQKSRIEYLVKNYTE